MRARVRSLAFAAALGLALFATPRPAEAVYQCGDQVDTCICGKDNPYPCCDNGGNCTWWAWTSACCNWAVALPGWGNANQWAGNANVNPNFDVSGAPVAKSVACRASGDYGHVAWVTSVNGGTVNVTEQNCWGNYGMRTWSYQGGFFDGGYIVRQGDLCACSGGQTQTEGCGSCGTRSRSCNGCDWGGWGACEGEGACQPGQTDSEACGDCGTHARGCNGSCQWDGFGACAGPDPNGGTEACATGQPGVCADGLRKCVDGTVACAPETPSSPEVCDGLDNDCNGEIDDGACALGGPPPPPIPDGGYEPPLPPPDGGPSGSPDGGAGGGGNGGAGGALAKGAGSADGMEDAGCACRAGQGDAKGAGWGAVVGALALFLTGARRRRQRD
jgi:MYXO-CTERM domain-containing protein